MKCRVFNTIQKQNARACRGKQRIQLWQKKHTSRLHFGNILVCFFNHKRIADGDFFAYETNYRSTCLFRNTERITRIRSKKKSLTLDNKWIVFNKNVPVQDGVELCRFPDKEIRPKNEPSTIFRSISRLLSIF